MKQHAKTTGGTAAVPKKGILKRLKPYTPYYILLIPVVIFYIVYHYLPIAGTAMAFQDYNFVDGFFGSEWVGLKHFIRFFANGDAWWTLGNTLQLSIRRLLFGFPAPVLFALLLNEVRHKGYKKFVQTVTYLPHFISWVIVYGVLYNIFSLNGVVNQITAVFGKEPVIYLAEAAYFRPMFVISAIWKELGWQAIVYLAALTSINTELYEAAMVDGASRLRRMWHITLPGIRSTVLTMFVLACGKVMATSFDQIAVMYNSTVSKVAETLDYYIYRTGLLQANNYSYAAAVGLFKSVVSLLLVRAANSLSKKLEEDGGLW